MREKNPNEKPKGIWHSFPENIEKILTLHHTHDNHMSGFKLFSTDGNEVTFGEFDTISYETIEYYVVKELTLDKSERLIGVISSSLGLKKAKHYDF